MGAAPRQRTAAGLRPVDMPRQYGLPVVVRQLTALLFAVLPRRAHAQGSSSAWRVLLTNTANDGYSGWAVDANRMDFYDWSIPPGQLTPYTAIESGSAFGDINAGYGAAGMIFSGNAWGGRADSNTDFWVGGNWSRDGNTNAVAVQYIMFRQHATDASGAHRKSLGQIQRFDDDTQTWVTASSQISLSGTAAVSLGVFSPPLPPSPPLPAPPPFPPEQAPMPPPVPPP